MKYRKLGKTGLEVSEIGFGAWGIGGDSYGNVSDEESKKALRVALGIGVNFIDTSNLYGQGHSEELIGEVLLGARSKTIVASKGGTLPHQGFFMPQDFSKKHLTNALENSLKRLKTDYIDLYQLHSPAIEELTKNNDLIRETLEKFKVEGKIRAYGVSVKSPQDAMTVINELGYECVQVNYNMIDQRAREIGLFDLAHKLNIGIIVRTPFVFGFLTGKMTGDEDFSSNDHRRNWPKPQLERWANAPKLFDGLIDGKKRTMAQLALKFCLSNSAVSTVIPGMINEREVKENVISTGLADLEEWEVHHIYSVYRDNAFYDKNAKK